MVGVAKAVVKASNSYAVHQPQVHFEAQQVYVSDSIQLLKELLRSPPVVRGKPMQLLQKGVPCLSPNVMVFRNGEAMSKHLFEEKFKKQYEHRFSKGKTW